MNIVLCALNAKYIHSSLAIRSLYEHLEDDYKKNIIKKEFTINQSADFILSEIFKLSPDVAAFSCYIWNIELVLEIVRNLKKVMPSIKIILGGPEVSYEYDYLLDFDVDYVVIGEGEETFSELVKMLVNKNAQEIKSVAIKNGYKYDFFGYRSGLNLDAIKFVYKEDDLSNFKDRIIYYETSRGCPFDCQYCLSSVEKGVRFLSFDRIKSDLDFFLEK